MVDDELKPMYAAYLARAANAFEAAMMLIPDNNGKAAWVATNWEYDPVVIAECERVKKQLGESMLPDKSQLAQLVWNIAESNISPEDKIKAAKLYAEIRGFVTKTENVTNLTIIPKAINVPTHGTDAEWEIAAAEQQEKLLNAAATKH